jgi:hypothetical protein
LLHGCLTGPLLLLELDQELPSRRAPSSRGWIRADSAEFFAEADAETADNATSTLLFQGWSMDQVRAAAEAGSKDAQAVML